MPHRSASAREPVRSGKGADAGNRLRTNEESTRHISTAPTLSSPIPERVPYLQLLYRTPIPTPAPTFDPRVDCEGASRYWCPWLTTAPSAAPTAPPTSALPTPAVPLPLVTGSTVLKFSLQLAAVSHEDCTAGASMGSLCEFAALAATWPASFPPGNSSRLRVPHVYSLHTRLRGSALLARRDPQAAHVQWGKKPVVRVLVAATC